MDETVIQQILMSNPALAQALIASAQAQMAQGQYEDMAGTPGVEAARGVGPYGVTVAGSPLQHAANAIRRRTGEQGMAQGRADQADALQAVLEALRRGQGGAARASVRQSPQTPSAPQGTPLQQPGQPQGVAALRGVQTYPVPPEGPIGRSPLPPAGGNSQILALLRGMGA